MGAAAVVEAEDSMAGSLEDSAVGILAEDTVLLPYLEDTLAGIMLPYLEGTMGDTAVGTMGGIVEDTTAVIEEGTMEVSMVEVFTHIGDYGDGGIGDGLFWDGPTQAGPIMPMEDTHIWDGPTIPRM